MSRRLTRARWRGRLRAESSQEASWAQTAKSTSSRLPVAAVSVRIGELHLQSFSRRDGQRLADTLQQELSSLLANGGIPDAWLQGRTIESAKLRDVRLRAGAKMQVLGQQLARALLRAGDGLERR